MISHVTLCRGSGCELKKVRKMRLGPTCQGLLSQEAAFQAKWEKDLFVLAAAETSQTWTFYTQRRLLTDTVLPQRLKDTLALKYTCLLFKCSDHDIAPPLAPQHASIRQTRPILASEPYEQVQGCLRFIHNKQNRDIYLFRAVGLHLFLSNHELFGISI